MLNTHQFGLFLIENVSAPPRGLDAVGVNAYATPVWALVAGVPEIVGGATADACIPAPVEVAGIVAAVSRAVAGAVDVAAAGAIVAAAACPQAITRPMARVAPSARASAVSVDRTVAWNSESIVTPPVARRDRDSPVDGSSGQALLQWCRRHGAGGPTPAPDGSATSSCLCTEHLQIQRARAGIRLSASRDRWRRVCGLATDPFTFPSSITPVVSKNLSRREGRCSCAIEQPLLTSEMSDKICSRDSIGSRSRSIATRAARFLASCRTTNFGAGVEGRVSIDRASSAVGEGAE